MQQPAIAEGTARAEVATPERFERPPFPGLRSFLEEDEPVFFGRGRDTDRVIEALRQADRRLLAVVGASGSGKSSLVRAGVIPRLKRGAIPGSERWLYLKPLKPSDYQQSPVLALAARLEPHLPGREAGELTQTLTKDPQALWRTRGQGARQRQRRRGYRVPLDHRPVRGAVSPLSTTKPGARDSWLC